MNEKFEMFESADEYIRIDLYINHANIYNTHFLRGVKKKLLEAAILCKKKIKSNDIFSWLSQSKAIY